MMIMTTMIITRHHHQNQKQLQKQKHQKKWSHQKWQLQKHLPQKPTINQLWVILFFYNFRVPLTGENYFGIFRDFSY